MEGCDDGVVAEQTKHDLKSLLSSSERDYLIGRDQIKIDCLKGKKIGLYFSASWCGPCRRFTPKLAEVYNELSSRGDFEVIFVSADEDDESFKEYFSKMPWLAIPFSDSKTRDNLDGLFDVVGIPSLVILDENGVVLTKDGVDLICEYGADAYPFTSEKVREIKEEEERARREQTLKSILVSPTRDFVVSVDGKKVYVSELEGKTVGLYFASSSSQRSLRFTPKLVEVHKKLKAEGEENFEVVMIPLDDDEESFKQGFYIVPVNDKSIEKLTRYFEVQTLPTLVIIGPDGKTLRDDVVETIEEHGAEAYPFTPEKFAQLEEKEKAKREAQTLESILVSGDLNFVLGKDGLKIPVFDLVGKTILLYFSANWCPPCHAFLPILIEAYNQIKSKHDAFDVIFISSDMDQSSFEDFFSTMPWLALPFEDERKESLERTFKVNGIPMVVAIGPTGRTVTTEARNLIMRHGADAYPFTPERLKEIEAQHHEMAKGWPKKVNQELHEHELELTWRQDFVCDACEEEGKIWSFYCKACDFDLHPKCAMKEDNGGNGAVNDQDMEEGENPKEGWVCDGDVCVKG
ncbi:Nucleoredoxin like [Actinidia chinensis var. chinensis]|uniref:protein-disulfide reductase n=1 Tax=Actinidia chinensis var. chinensis TaxID=1590841 RepID=A0A2R6RF12_ACTCC|nr:Nucleoredoxin like [Actinidia chinensis var. chinensis]